MEIPTTSFTEQWWAQVYRGQPGDSKAEGLLKSHEPHPCQRGSPYHRQPRAFLSFFKIAADPRAFLPSLISPQISSGVWTWHLLSKVRASAFYLWIFLSSTQGDQQECKGNRSCITPAAFLTSQRQMRNNHDWRWAHNPKSLAAQRNNLNKKSSWLNKWKASQN